MTTFPEGVLQHKPFLNRRNSLCYLTLWPSLIKFGSTLLDFMDKGQLLMMAYSDMDHYQTPERQFGIKYCDQAGP